MSPKYDAGTATRHYRAFWQRRCHAAAAGAVLKPSGGNCAVLPKNCLKQSGSFLSLFPYSDGFTLAMVLHFAPVPRFFALDFRKSASHRQQQLWASGHWLCREAFKLNYTLCKAGLESSKTTYARYLMAKNGGKNHLGRRAKDVFFDLQCRHRGSRDQPAGPRYEHHRHDLQRRQTGPHDEGCCGRGCSLAGCRYGNAGRFHI